MPDWWRRAPRAHQLDGALDAVAPDPASSAAAPGAHARQPPPPQSMLQYLRSPLAKAVLVSTASSVLSGYDQGVIAAAMLTMKYDLQLDSVEQEMSIGIMNIAAAAGGLLAGVAAERFGRKKAIALANAFFLAGSLAIALAQNFGMLFAGRMLQGIGVGFALVVAPIFTAELVPAEVRGRLVSLGDVCTNGGILLGYSAGLLFLKTADGWRYMFWLGCAPALLIVASIFSAPESPRWLVSVGRVEDARAVVHRLHPNEAEANVSLDEMVAAVAALKQQPKSGWQDVLWHPDPVVRGMVWRGLAIALFSQLTGTEAVVYYAGDIVQQAGISSMRDTLLAIMAVGLCKLLFLLAASQLFDRIGRRPMLLASAAGLAGSLVVLSLATAGEARRPVLAIGGLCAFMASFSIGFSPLVYVVCSELFPLGVRARAMSCALFVTRVIAGLISSVFVTLREELTPTGAWLVFVPVSVAAFLFVWAKIPETNGLGLEGVHAMFEEVAQKKKAKEEARRARRRRNRTAVGSGPEGGGAGGGDGGSGRGGGAGLPAAADDEAPASSCSWSASVPAPVIRSSSRAPVGESGGIDLAEIRTVPPSAAGPPPGTGPPPAGGPISPVPGAAGEPRAPPITVDASVSGTSWATAGSTPAKTPGLSASLAAHLNGGGGSGGGGQQAEGGQAEGGAGGECDGQHASVEIQANGCGAHTDGTAQLQDSPLLPHPPPEA